MHEELADVRAGDEVRHPRHAVLVQARDEGVVVGGGEGDVVDGRPGPGGTGSPIVAECAENYVRSAMCTIAAPSA